MICNCCRCVVGRYVRDSNAPQDVIWALDAWANEEEETCMQVAFLHDQIKALADHIVAEFPGEPSESEGAIDTAIRLMGRQ